MKDDVSSETKLISIVIIDDFEENEKNYFSKKSEK